MQTRFHCLVLEDDDGVALAVEAFLDGIGGQAHRFTCVTDARQALDAEAFDLFILDHKLPDGRGTEFFRHLRDQGHQAPVIMMTGDVNFKLEKRPGNTGFFTLLPKPCDWSMIKTHLIRAGVMAA